MREVSGGVVWVVVWRVLWCGVDIGVCVCVGGGRNVCGVGTVVWMVV